MLHFFVNTAGTEAFVTHLVKRENPQRKGEHQQKGKTILYSLSAVGLVQSDLDCNG